MKSLLLLFCLTVTSSFASQPGTLDTTFKTSGGPDNYVHAVARQKDGKVVIGGSFQNVHGSRRPGICRLLTTGLVDLTFNPGTGVNGTVYAVAVQTDGKILVGGQFDEFNGISCDNLIRLNANGSLDATFQRRGIDGTVHAIALRTDGKIMVGGDFDEADYDDCPGVAMLQSDGKRDESFVSGLTTSAVVYSLAIRSDGMVYVGGLFVAYGLDAVTNLVRVTSTGARDNTFAPNLIAGSGCRALAVQKDGRVLVGGSNYLVGDPQLRYLLRLETTGAVDASFGVGNEVVGEVKALGLQTDGKIMIGGLMTQVGSATVSRFARLKTDGTLDTTHQVGSGTSGTVYAIHVHTDNKTLVGGDFNNYGGVGRSNVARVLSSGLVDVAFVTGVALDQAVSAVAMQADGKVIVAGSFSSYNGVPRAKLARLKTDGTLDTTFIVGSGSTSAPNALAVQADGKILVGGVFLSFNGVSHRGITRLNADGSVDAGFNPGTGVAGAVYAIAVQSDGRIVIAGDFTGFNGGSSAGIVRLLSDGSVDPSFASGSGIEDEVFALAIRPNGKIIAAGNFLAYNGNAAFSLVSINSDGSYDASFVTNSVGTNDPIHAIGLLPDGDLMIGGAFTTYRNIERNRLARINPNGSLDSSFDPGAGPDNKVQCLYVQPDEKVVIGGYFTMYRNQERLRLARVLADGALDNSFDVGSGVNNAVLCIAAQLDGKLIIGGSFSVYNGATAGRVMRVLQSYAHVATTFTGFTSASDAALASLMGKVSISLTATGSFTGSLTLGTEKITLTGAFNREGAAAIIAVRKDKSPLYVNLTLRRGEGGGAVIQGDVRDLQARSISLLANAPYFSSSKLPANHFSGRHHLSLFNPSTVVGPLPPSGHGYLTCTVSTTGSTTLVGKAPDGTALSTTAALSQDGELLLHFPLYTSKGFMNGTISIDAADVDHECTGGLLWSRPTSTTYPAGFTMDLAVEGQIYRAEPVGLPSIQVGDIIISGGHLPVSNPGLGTADLSFSASNVATVTNSTLNSLKVTINRTTGIFTGSFIPTGLTKAVTIQGIVLNRSAHARGYVLITIGGVTLPSTVLIVPSVT